MSGHSKWSTIKREKGAQDQARGAMFTKLANNIMIAVREGGGGSPQANFRLRLAIDKAKAANMPKANIERAIERASGRDNVDSIFEEVVYEGFGPGGVAIIVTGITNNKQRTASTVKNIFTANGGTLGGAGSSAYLFEKVGRLKIGHSPNKSEEQLLSFIVESGGSDLVETQNHYLVYCVPQATKKVEQFLQENGISIEGTELTYRPLSEITLSQEKAEKAEVLLHELESLDDVVSVISNKEIK